MLIFYVGSDCYCCSCDSMLEIVPKISLKQIPQAPNYFAGILNYGGEPVPVIDLSTIIIGRESNNCMHTRIMIFKNPLEGPIKILGIIAEKIIEAREMNPALFNESGFQIKNLTFLNGIYNTEKESIQKINVNQFFEFVPEIHSKER